MTCKRCRIAMQVLKRVKSTTLSKCWLPTLPESEAEEAEARWASRFFSKSDGSTINHLLHLGGVACALRLDRGKHVLSGCQVSRYHFDGRTSKILLQAMQLGRARNWNDPGLLREKPRQRQPTPS